VLLGNYWSLQAVKNLSPQHPDSVWRIVFWSKMLARRANFTDVGWRYRNLAILSFVAIPVIVLLHWFASAG
jgi:hypothetical protein